MAKARKSHRTPARAADSRRQTAPQRVKRPAAQRPPLPAPADLASDSEPPLTPDRVRHAWHLQHPDRPEVRATLERLYRQSH